MKLWVRRAAKVGGGLLVVLAAGAGYIGYRFYTHGPPALARADVSVPTARLRYGTAPSQTIDVRVPPGRGPFPVVVLVHGGCWNTTYGQPRDMAPLADALRQRGIASLNVAYRRVGEPGGGWPGTMSDVGKGIDSIRVLAARFHLDPSRVVVVGHSAGAQIALWSATRDRLPRSSALHVARPLMPRAVVAVDGPGALAEFIGDDAEICGAPAIVPYMGGTPAQVPQRYRDATAQDHLPLAIPQYFILAGLRQYMEPYVKRAQAAGDPVFTNRPSRATHFDVLMPWQAPGQSTISFVGRAIGGMTNAQLAAHSAHNKLAGSPGTND